MKNNLLNLPWGKNKITFNLPPTWQVEGTLEPAALPGVASLDKELQRSLQAPIGCQMLSKLVNKNSRIALVMDDLSRPTPIARLLPAILAELKRGGVAPSQIILIPALGVHRPMEQSEIYLLDSQLIIRQSCGCQLP